jgi:hypothetical protein
MSDGQFSSKPIRSGHKTDLTAGYPSGAGPLSADQTRAFLESRAVRREVDALLDETYIGANRDACAPLPNRLPRAAEEMGQPIASAVLVQEYLIGLIFLRVAGWIFLAFGALILIGAVIVFFEFLRNPNQQGGPPPWAFVIMAGVGLAIGGAGAWFGYFRGRVITERCWLCTHGVIWMTNSVFDWYSWADVPEVYCDTHAPRPAVGIRFDRNLSWISFSNTQVSHRMVQLIENRASAARMPAVLKRLAEGATISFGDARLNRQWMAHKRDRFDWNQVAAVQVEDQHLVLLGPGNRELASFPLEEIAFPSLFAALARAILAHARERN